jgi:hypothetical protein
LYIFNNCEHDCLPSHLTIRTLECAWIENLKNGKMFRHNLHVISSFSFIEIKVFLRILWCSLGGNHLETNLPNTSYMLDMKKKKTKVNFFICEFLPKFDLKIMILTNTFLQTPIKTHWFELTYPKHKIIHTWYILLLNHNFVLWFMKTNQHTNIWTSMVTNT